MSKALPRRRRLPSSALVLIAGLLLVLASTTDAFGAARGTTFAPCVGSGQIAALSYKVGVAGHTPAVAGWSITGLSRDGCDGSSVVLITQGNSAGDPAAPATETLATYDSKLDPCTHVPLAQPVVVEGGHITVAGCATGGTAGFTSIHDVTQVSLNVRGDTITTVLGETFSEPGSSPSSGTTGKGASVLATTEQLPFTGSYAALTFWLGVLTLLGGLIIFLIGRRRRTQADTD